MGMLHSNSRTASQQAYEEIRDRILNGEITGGTKVVEEKLATETGFSRTPIREALRQLTNEGLIVNKKSFNLPKRTYGTFFK